MILTKNVTILVTKYNKDMYPSYKFGDHINILSSELPNGSGIKVSVKCDYCGFEKKIQYRKYLKNTKKETVKYSCSNKCSVNKYRDTCMSLYGVDNAFKVKEIRDRYKKTCMDLYGVDNALKDPTVSKKMIKTKEIFGIYSTNRKNYEIYKNKCVSLTRLNKIKLIESWNGYDYYDSEFIFDNFKLNPLSPEYPCVDHKFSILEGYESGVDPIEISKIENLCITKRSINSSFGGRPKNLLNK